MKFTLDTENKTVTVKEGDFMLPQISGLLSGEVLSEYKFLTDCGSEMVWCGYDEANTSSIGVLTAFGDYSSAFLNPFADFSGSGGEEEVESYIGAPCSGKEDGESLTRQERLGNKRYK